MGTKTEAKSKYITKIEQLEQLSERERGELKKVTDKFAFRSNDYYLSLIDWDDPDDPIRRIIIPHIQELDEWGRLDPSDEHTYTVIPGLEHKYNSTALFLVSNVCDGICRYCFRKRVFIDPQSAYLRDIPAAMQYIKEHTEIQDYRRCVFAPDDGEVQHRKKEDIYNDSFCSSEGVDGPGGQGRKYAAEGRCNDSKSNASYKRAER